MTPAQVKAARLLLGWSRKELARMCGVPIGSLGNFEYGFVPPSMTPERLTAIRAALEAAGIEFTTGDAPGVKVRKPA